MDIHKTHWIKQSKLIMLYQRNRTRSKWRSSHFKRI